MLTRAQKEEQVAALSEKFRRATAVYVADYRGIDVQAANDLRRRIRREGGGDYEYRVTKNTLLRRASAGSSVEAAAALFTGPTAIALSYGDPVGLARVLRDFQKDHEAFEFKGGVLEGRAVDGGEIAVLATLPPLDSLRATLIGLLQAPATKLARLLTEPGAQLARLFSARSRQEGSS
jgi:large subunit ribosomal protein L10